MIGGYLVNNVNGNMKVDNFIYLLDFFIFLNKVFYLFLKVNLCVVLKFLVIVELFVF